MATATKSTPIRTAGAIIASVSAIAGGLLTIPGIPDYPWLPPAVGLVLLVCTVLTTVLIPKLTNTVTPSEDVLSYRNSDGAIVPGHAADVLVTVAADTGYEDPEDDDYPAKHREGESP